ncbi:MAG TPA: class I SAM-dependent methyltransferase [Bradyrhizobium sp.]|jgi:SAM-dependent methyltransferase
MTEPDRQAHWQTVYQTRGEGEVSWSQPSPEPSLGLIEKFARGPSASIVDIGGGASRLVDALHERGYGKIAVLDLSEAALRSARDRLGVEAASVQWVAADVTKWQLPQAFDIWHDRAAFHFLVDPRDRDAYIARLHQGVKSGGHAIIATFALDGPEKCSGLPVQRYDHTALGKALGSDFALVHHQPHHHVTPWGAAQSFQFSVFRRS